jgi:isoleucyl-tRNA synthetase
MIAPFAPFLAEHLWRSLTGVFGGRARTSVHLCDYPDSDPNLVDRQLSARMQLAREIVSLGRKARMEADLKVRQPLAKVEVILARDTHRDWLEAHSGVIAKELNVKQVEFTDEADQYINYQVQPNFKRLGPRVGKRMPAIKKALSEANGSALVSQLETDGRITLAINAGLETVDLDEQDVEIRLQAKSGWAAAYTKGCVVVLATALTEELIREGYARDIVRFIQQLRKERGCEYADRIEIALVTNEQDLLAAVQDNAAYIMTETLAESLGHEPLVGVEAIDLQIAGKPLTLHVRRLTRP